MAAFRNADVDELVAVSIEDALFEMPPFLTWFGHVVSFQDADALRHFGLPHLLPTESTRD